jgi:hypothetical protein
MNRASSELRKDDLVIKKSLASVAVAAGVLGTVGVAAAPAMAISDDGVNSTSINGNGADKAYGNTTTGGYMSPNISLINGSLNDVCVGFPFKGNVQSVVGLINIGVQDLLNSQPQQICTENSTQVDGDDPLSRILSDIPILSQNGALEAK